MSAIVKSLGGLTRVLSAVTVLALVGCGGGGGDTAGTSIGAVGGIGGTGIKGPVSGATVTAYAIANGVPGSQIGNATTDGQGNFTLSIGSYAGPVMLQLTGGTYTDEASGGAMTMASGDVMTAVLPSVAAGAQINGVQMTPLTSMAQKLAQHMSGGMTEANIAAANAAVGNYFSVDDIVHTPPMNPLVAGSGTGASQAAIDYGMTLAAMSQLAKTMGMTTSSAMVTAMMNDAADGMMDGKSDGTSVMMGAMGGGMGGAMPANAGTSGLATAMSAFVANTTQNKSGVAASVMSALIAKLDGSSGQIMGGVTPSSVGVSISGMVVDGPVATAGVAAFAVTHGAKGAQIGSATTDANGNFTMTLGSYAGPVMLQASGGSYTDDATGATVAMASGDMMTLVLPTISAGSAASGVQVTPVTSMAQSMAAGMGGGMTDANIGAANAALGNYFMIGDIVHTPPMDPLAAGSGTTATQASMNYGMTLAAMSQYAKSLGMTAPSAMTTAMMKDAADGVMDGMGMGGQIAMGGGMSGGGMMGGGAGGSMMQPSAGTTGLATAMADFMASSQNRSGLTAGDMTTLMQQLRTSNGHMH
jgi:hypothetical protein